MFRICAALTLVPQGSLYCFHLLSAERGVSPRIDLPFICSGPESHPHTPQRAIKRGEALAVLQSPQMLRKHGQRTEGHVQTATPAWPYFPRPGSLMEVAACSKGTDGKSGRGKAAFCTMMMLSLTPSFPPCIYSIGNR